MAIRIAEAVNKLLAENKPVTRKAIAEIAGCQIRTVSLYKSIWKGSAPPYRNTPQPIKKPLIERKPFEAIIHELESLDFTGMDHKTLESHIAKLRFYADCSKPHPEICKRIVRIGNKAQKVLNMLGSK